MADNKNTGGVIAVSVVSLLLVGTAIFFISKTLKKKQSELPNLPPSPQPSGNDVISQQPVEQPKKDVLGTLGGIVGAMTDLFSKRKTDATNDKFAEFTFPIKQGQRGANVKKLQQLILSINKNALPKFGADGQFGTETANALKSLIGKSSVDSQADIDAIKKVGYGNVSKFLMNQQLGIKLY